MLEMTGERPAGGGRPGARLPRRESPRARPGVAVAATLEGSRPLLVEVQALVAPAGTARRAGRVRGLDANRLALLVAVLGRRAGLEPRAARTLREPRRRRRPSTSRRSTCRSPSRSPRRCGTGRSSPGPWPCGEVPCSASCAGPRPRATAARGGAARLRAGDRAAQRRHAATIRSRTCAASTIVRVGDAARSARGAIDRAGPVPPGRDDVYRRSAGTAQAMQQLRAAARGAPGRCILAIALTGSGAIAAARSRRAWTARAAPCRLGRRLVRCSATRSCRTSRSSRRAGSSRSVRTCPTGEFVARVIGLIIGLLIGPAAGPAAGQPARPVQLAAAAGRLVVLGLGHDGPDRRQAGRPAEAPAPVGRPASPPDRRPRR